MDEKKLVKELKQAMFKSKPKPWYEIFLAYFVIMWHLKFIHGEAVGFMNCREQTDSAKQVGVFITRMAGEWNHSAENMLYHFRHVLHGNLPFQKAIEDIEGVRSKANLDLEAVSYMKRVVTYLSRNGWMEKSSTTEKTKANDQSSEEWIRQLFEE
ncbi:hypothetical protein SLS56_007733 [Neofusicoccum ribis]|uniref:Uncharacterized protein n=1 Tax=Neofusicoccum ribis TaxID=45134 RepID=A0ABR3SMN7_9PEZI